MLSMENYLETTVNEKCEKGVEDWESQSTE